MTYKKLKSYNINYNFKVFKSHSRKRVAFSIIELIFAIVLISIITSVFIPKQNHSQLNHAANKIILYLKYTRYIAMLDNKYDVNDEMWFRERWTLKFQRCSSKIGGLYYLIYSDKNHKGSPNKDECLKDPVTNEYLYSHYDCDAGQDESKYILLTQQYGVTNVEISCNSTSTIGQISFGHDGKIYSKLGLYEDESSKYEIKQTCYIDMYNKLNKKITIAIEPYTGLIHKINSN